MKVALQVLAYDVDRFIGPMIRNAAPWVDKIFVAYPDRPWDYNPEARSTRKNPTPLQSIPVAGLSCPVEVVNGDWLLEEDTRNDLLGRARAEGFDWMIIQDADEFYTDDCWEQIRARMAKTDGHGLKTSWYTFWKSSRYVLTHRTGAIKDANVGAAIRCDSDTKFVRARRTNLEPSFAILDAPCYHYGYVRSDDEVLAKVTSWGHAGEFNGPLWYRLKWAQWTQNTVNLHPSRYGEWYRAIPFPLHQPSFAEEFDLPIERTPPKPRVDQIKSYGFDRVSQLRGAYRNFRQLHGR